MKIIELGGPLKEYIWSPLALTGMDLAPQENILIEIAGGFITSLNSIAKVNLPAAVAGHPHFYCLEEGLTLLPSLIDAHVHVALDGNTCGSLTGEESEALPPGVERALNLFLHCGITAVRDGGDRRAFNLLAGQKAVRGPLVISTGQALRKRDSYGSFLGEGYSSARELPSLLERLIDSGIDQLKVLLSGIVSFSEYGRVEPPAITSDELQYITGFARRKGIRVMAHASSDRAVDMAVRAGVDSIEHGYFLSVSSLEMMARKQIAWVPTIIPVAVQAREPLLERWGRQEIEVITRTYEEHLAKLSLAHRLGVAIGLGTDSGAAGVRHGLDLVKEMLLYSCGLLSNRAILQAAIVENARILGLEAKLGSLAVKREPFLVAVKGNPLTDLRCLEQPEWLFHLRKP